MKKYKLKQQYIFDVLQTLSWYTRKKVPLISKQGCDIL